MNETPTDRQPQDTRTPVEFPEWWTPDEVAAAQQVLAVEGRLRATQKTLEALLPATDEARRLVLDMDELAGDYASAYQDVYYVRLLRWRPDLADLIAAIFTKPPLEP